MRSSFAILALLTVSIAPLAARADTVAFSFTTTTGGALGSSIFNEPLTITGSFDSTAVTENMGTFSVPTTFYFNISGLPLVDSAAGSEFLTVTPGTSTAELVGVSGLLFSLDSTDLNGLTGLTPGFSASGSPTAGGNSENFDVDIVGFSQTFPVDFTSAGGPTTLIVGNPAAGPSPVPEPSSLLLISTGLMGVVGTARRRLARR